MNPHEHRPVTIGVAGGTASGKSTVSARLLEQAGSNAAMRHANREALLRMMQQGSVADPVASPRETMYCALLKVTPPKKKPAKKKPAKAPAKKKPAKKAPAKKPAKKAPAKRK